MCMCLCVYVRVHVCVCVCLSVQILTFEDHTFHDSVVLYILAGMDQYVDSKNSADHELSHSPYEYTHCQ